MKNSFSASCSFSSDVSYSPSSSCSSSCPKPRVSRSRRSTRCTAVAYQRGDRPRGRPQATSEVPWSLMRRERSSTVDEQVTRRRSTEWLTLARKQRRVESPTTRRTLVEYNSAVSISNSSQKSSLNMYPYHHKFAASQRISVGQFHDASEPKIPSIRYRPAGIRAPLGTELFSLNSLLISSIATHSTSLWVFTHSMNRSSIISTSAEWTSGVVRLK